MNPSKYLGRWLGGPWELRDPEVSGSQVTVGLGVPGWEVGRSSSLGTPDIVAAPSECVMGGLTNKGGGEEHL